MTENKSTGPRTEEGKAISSRNSFKHGLAARRLFIPGEDESVFYEQLQSFTAHLNPDGPLESDLVEHMCVAQWLKDRAIRMQTLAFEKVELGEIPKDLRLFIRYQTTNENAYYRALRTLQALQKARREEAEFVSRPRFTPDLNNPIGPRKLIEMPQESPANNEIPTPDPPNWRQK